MANDTQVIETTTNESTNAKASAAEKQASIKAKVNKEVAAYIAAAQAATQAAMEIGPLGLVQLAREVGESVDSNGRPAFAPWHRFVSVLALTKQSYTQHDALLREARKAVPAGIAKEKADRFVKSKSKAGIGGKATCTLTMNPPAVWDIALGS